jgi:putative ubiquitin-RnfH superfamily antitoxin RatB of RatAB toxin-antitoxin module
VTRKHCSVAFALPGRQFLWELEVAADASVADLLGEARRLAAARGEADQVPWETDSIGIFGEPCRREDIPRAGDRVEIYRALLNDPRASRRARVRGR